MEFNFLGADGLSRLWTHILGKISQNVPMTRTINNKSLESDVVLNASDVGAEVAGTANTVVSEHDVNINAHNDIRILINNLTTRLNTLANSDDTTLDQMSEIVAYIKNNKSLIEGITNNKVNVSDIINNLTTNVSTKTLSAAQGVVLKGLIDDLTVEVGKKALSSDLTTHTGNNNIHITSDERTKWNAAKTKLDDIEEGANRTIVDSSLSSSSVNPVQNKVIKEVIDGINTRIDDNIVTPISDADIDAICGSNIYSMNEVMY